MKNINILTFSLLLPAVLCSNLLRFKRYEDTKEEPCVCVPYYQCGPDGKIDVYGTGQLGIRIPTEPNPECTGVEICCGLPDDDDDDDDGGDKSKVETEPGTFTPPPPITEQTPKTPPYEPEDPTSDGSTVVMPVKPPGVSGCGIRRLNPLDERIDTTIRITGKNEVPESSHYGEFPWMIAVFQEIHDKKEFKCGGSLIAPDVVLTAAHCVAKLDANEVIVRAGDWDSRTSEEPLPHQDRRGKRLSIHKDYDSGNLRYDIALIFLERPFELNQVVDTICINKIDFEPNFCYATGWGVNSFSEKGLYQPILKKVALPIVDRATCQSTLRTTRLGNYFKLHKSFMCAGGVASQDTCSGDGGGPLVCSIPSSPYQYTQVGIVSWGIGCGKEKPGVYASVDYFYDWIKSQVEL